MARQLIRTDSHHPDLLKLIPLLDAELAIRDGDEHEFYVQFNKLDAIKYVVLLYSDKEVAACGAIKHYKDKIVEIKRMFVRDKFRRQGMASQVLQALEEWAKTLGYEKCILETGIRQPEAIQLYLKNGYQEIPNYGQYRDAESSRCFEKKIY